jgi:hypothetical protein
MGERNKRLMIILLFQHQISLLFELKERDNVDILTGRHKKTGSFLGLPATKQ